MSAFRYVNNRFATCNFHLYNTEERENVGHIIHYNTLLRCLETACPITISVIKHIHLYIFTQNLPFLTSPSIYQFQFPVHIIFEKIIFSSSLNS